MLWRGLPRLLATMPGRYLYYVPEAIVERLLTPLPSALPPAAATAPRFELQSILATPWAMGTATPAPMPPAAPAAAPALPAQMSPTQTAPAVRPSATPAPAAATPDEPRYPAKVRIANLPIIPQKFNNCGPTNLAIVLNYYGLDVDQFDVAAVVRPNYEDRNVSPEELAGYVNEHTTLSAASYVGGDIDLLRRLLAAGFPVIIEKGLQPDATTGWMGHYLTVFGYDDDAGQFLVRDTFLGPWQEDGRFDYEETAQRWAEFNGAFVVVYTPEQAAELAETIGPRFADASTMWAVVAADRAAGADRAADAAARDRAFGDPEDAFAWFNLGAALTALSGLHGDASYYSTAAMAFDQARALGLPPRLLWYRFAPYEAYLALGRHDDVLTLTAATLASQGGRHVEETYYYQGVALLAKGDVTGARRSLQRVIELNPESAVGRAATALLAGLP